MALELDLSKSRDLLSSVQGMVGKETSGVSAEGLHQQAVDLGASFSLLSTILQQNIGKLGDTEAADVVQGTDTQTLIERLYSRDDTFSNEDGKALVASIDKVMAAVPGIEGELQVSVESLVDQFSSMATNTDFSDNRRNGYLRDLIGVMKRNEIGSSDQLAALAEIAQKNVVTSADMNSIASIGNAASSEAKDSNLRIRGTLDQLSSRFKSMQISQEEIYSMQNSNNMRDQLENAANEISIGNSDALTEVAGTSLELFGIGGPVGAMMSEYIGDKVASATSYMGEQVSGKLLDLDVTQKVIDKVSSIRAKLQEKRDRLFDKILFRNRSDENENVAEENTQAQMEHASDISQKEQKQSEAVAKLAARERKRSDKKANKKLAKDIGKESGSGMAVVGAGMLAGLVSMGGMLMAGLTLILPGLALAAVAAASVAAGTLLSKGMDKATQFFTGDENATLGGKLFDMYDGFFGDVDEREAQSKKTAAMAAKNKETRARLASGEVTIEELRAERVRAKGEDAGTTTSTTQMGARMDATQKTENATPAAPIVNVQPAPVIVQPAPQAIAPKTTSIDDTGLLVLQRTVG